MDDENPVYIRHIFDEVTYLMRCFPLLSVTIPQQGRETMILCGEVFHN
jgi:hypothetical protein